MDAALDAQNVTALVAYLQKAAFQSIVISLKDKLYSECEALVGVSAAAVAHANAMGGGRNVVQIAVLLTL